MRRTRAALIVAFAALTLGAIACGLPFLGPNRAAPATARPVVAGKSTASFASSTNAESTRAVVAGTQIELSEAEVTALMREALGQQGYRVNDLKVELEEGRFVAMASQKVSFFALPIRVEGTAQVVNGQVQLVPISAMAAGVPVPQETIDAIAASSQGALAGAIERLPIRPTDVRILPGIIIVLGVAK